MISNYGLCELWLNISVTSDIHNNRLRCLRHFINFQSFQTRALHILLRRSEKLTRLQHGQELQEEGSSVSEVSWRRVLFAVTRRWSELCYWCLTESRNSQVSFWKAFSFFIYRNIETMTFVMPHTARAQKVEARSQPWRTPRV